MAQTRSIFLSYCSCSPEYHTFFAFHKFNLSPFHKYILLFITCLRWPLFLCTGVCHPSAPHPTTSAWPSAWPEPPSSSAALTYKPWYGCCTFAGSLLPPRPGLSVSRQPAVCRPHRASWSHGRFFSGCHCPARGWWIKGEKRECEAGNQVGALMMDNDTSERILSLANGGRQY